MSKDIIAQLKQLKQGEVKPSEAWLKSNRALLLSQIKNTVSEEEQSVTLENFWNTLSLFVPRPVVFNFVRPVAVLLIVTIVATSGWITSVDAAYNALPGDFLYPAKRAAEKTQVAVASVVASQTTVTKLHSEFAKRRASETKQIVAGNDPQKQKKVQQVVNDLKTEIANINTSLEKIKIASNDTAVSADVKNVKQDTEQVKNTLQEVKTSLLAASNINDSAATKEIAQSVNEAKDLAKDASVNAVEVMVKKHLEGDTSVSTAEVRKEINSALQSVASDVAQSKQSVEGVQAVVTAAKTEAKDLVPKTADATSTAANVALNQKISEVASATNNAAVETKTATDSANKSVTEAVTALQKGDLATVLEKVREANTATKEAEKISDRMVTNVQQLVPAPVIPVLVGSDINKDAIRVIIDTSTVTSVPSIKVIIPSTTVPVTARTTTTMEKR